jgi:hypothetical protein
LQGVGACRYMCVGRVSASVGACRYVCVGMVSVVKVQGVGGCGLVCVGVGRRVVGVGADKMVATVKMGLSGCGVSGGSGVSGVSG